MTGDVVVIGVGNEFRHDDGFGPAVIERLRGQEPPGVRLAVTDGDPARLIDLWADARVAVVVDAARAEPRSPGTIHRLALPPCADGRSGPGSSHGLGLGDAVQLAGVLGRLPGRLVVYAVEPADVSLGVGLSPAVHDALGRVVAAIADELRVSARGGEPDVS